MSGSGETESEPDPGSCHVAEAEPLSSERPAQRPAAEGVDGSRPGTASRAWRGPRLSASRKLSLLLLVAAAIRLGLLLQQWPASNSDEATMGLMAMHIAGGRDFPSFMYGQSYMGTAEAYLAAAVFRLSGPSLAGLRIAMLLMFLLFLLALYVLARRLYGPGVALLSVGLLSLGSRELYGHQLVAQGAIPETLLAGTLLLLLGHRLLEMRGVRRAAAGQRWRLAGWGFVAMIGLWSTVLVAPFVVTSAALVAMTIRRRASLPGGLRALGGGLGTGAVPWIAHDVSHPWRDSGVVAVVHMYLNGGTGLNGGQSTGIARQIVNTVTTSLAYVTGGSAVAHPTARPAWFFGYSDSWRPPTDDAVTTAWGIALILLWALGVITCVRVLRRRGQGEPGGDGPTPAQVYARLAMLAAAGLTVAAFAASPTPGIAPANNVRYIIGVLAATPAVVAALRDLRGVAPRVSRPLTSAVIVFVVCTLGLGTVQAYRDAAGRSGESSSRQLSDALQQAGLTHVYSGYRECNQLMFLSQERIVCAVLSGGPAAGLRPGLDRYRPYRTAVNADPRSAYVFPSGDPRNTVLLRSRCRWWKRWRLADHEIWQPADHCPGLPTSSDNAAQPATR